MNKIPVRTEQITDIRKKVLNYLILTDEHTGEEVIINIGGKTFNNVSELLKDKGIIPGEYSAGIQEFKTERITNKTEEKINQTPKTKNNEK